MSVGQSLQQLGQQVGQQLAMREYQKQAASALPAMQQQYDSAFNKIKQGDTTGGYMDVLKTNMAFGSTQNPFLLPYINQASQFAEDAAKNVLSQGWQKIQAGSGAAGGGAMRSMPTTQELSDPNFQLEEDYINVGQGMPASQYRGSNLQGTPEQQAQQAEEQRISQTDPDAEAGRELMAMKQDEDVSFGFGTLSKFKPKDEVIHATREEIEKRKSLSPEERIDYNTQIAETAIDYQPPKGRKLQPFENIIGFENSISVEGPIAGGLKIKEIGEKYSEKSGKQVDRTMIPADDSDEKTFDATIFNLEKASNFVKRNPQLRKIIEVTGGDLTRIDIEDSGKGDRKVYKAFVDGVDMGELSTEDNFNEKAALELLIDAPYVLNRNGYKVIKGEKQDAQAATGEPRDAVKERFPVRDQSTQQGLPVVSQPAQASPQFSEENPYAASVSKAQTEPAARTRTQQRGPSLTAVKTDARKKLESIDQQFKSLDNLKTGRRAATASEKARRWEELNAEKKRLEGILAR
jgi:hypothetical protein